MAPPKGRRVPACEPCRASKLSCDRAKPECRRCVEKAVTCLYRQTPSTRRASHYTASSTPYMHDDASNPSNVASASTPASSPSRPLYPNPGYMGASSHIAIFRHISANDSKHDASPLNQSFNSASSTVPDAAPLALEAEAHAVEVAERMQ